MSEYVKLSELQEFCKKYTPRDVVGLILADRTDLLHITSGTLVPDDITNRNIKKMKTERAMEILNNIVNFVSIANDTEDTINELLKYGFEAEELVSDFHFSKIDVENVTGEKIEEEEVERE